MNGTPRLRSAYPSTPGSAQRTPALAQSQASSRVRSPLPNLPNVAAEASPCNPVIPVEALPAPTQRLFTLALYGALFVYRLYDWWTVVEGDTTSFSLFLKWFLIDFFFFFGVPLLRIPWLEWSQTTSGSAIAMHGIMNGMLMFRIPVSFVVLDASFLTNMEAAAN